jgi:hypothetical protein
MSEERDPPPPDGGDDDVDLGAIDQDGNPIDDVEDAEPEPDEPEPEEAEPERQPEPEREQRRQRAKGEAQRWRERYQREAATSSDLTRRIAALEQQRAQPAYDPQAAARAEQEFRASLELMSPADAAIAVANRQAQQFREQLTQVELRGFDRSDKANFDAMTATDRRAARYAAEVEQILAQRRQMGDYTLGRRDILAFKLGEELLARGAAQVPAQRRAANGRVARETTRPASGRGDVAAGGRARNQDVDDEALLRRVTTSDV